MTTSNPAHDPMDDLGPRPSAGQIEMPDLEALRASIAGDIEQKQGPFLQMGALARYWPVVAAMGLALFFMGIWPSGAMDGMVPVQIASIAGAVAAVLCVLVAALAPTKPAAAERVAMAGLLAAGVALGAEGYLAATAPNSELMMKGVLKCGAFVVGFGFVPFGFLLYAMKRSGAPARRLHIIAMGAAALSVGGVAMWRHCPDTEMWHVVLAHVALPALSLPLFALLIWAAIRPKPMA